MLKDDHEQQPSTCTLGVPTDVSMVEWMLCLLRLEPPKGRTRLCVAFVAPAWNTMLKVFEGLQKHLLGKQMAGWSVAAFEEPVVSIIEEVTSPLPTHCVKKVSLYLHSTNWVQTWLHKPLLGILNG